jgi:nitrogen-specific signal transduction histidine kinase
MATASPSSSLPLALLESLVQLAPLDVLLFDSDLICRYAAPAGESLFGRSATELVGETATALFSPQSGDLHTALREAAENAGSFDYPAYRYTMEDAETQQYYCWSVRIQPVNLLDYRGRDEFRGVLVTLADVQDLADERDRLQAGQERLLAEQARLHASLEDLRARLASSTAAQQEVRAQVRDLLAPAYGFLQLIAERPEALSGQSPERLIHQVVLPRLRAIVATLDAATQAATDQNTSA